MLAMPPEACATHDRQISGSLWHRLPVAFLLKDELQSELQQARRAGLQNLAEGG